MMSQGRNERLARTIGDKGSQMLWEQPSAATFFFAAFADTERPVSFGTVVRVESTAVATTTTTATVTAATTAAKTGIGTGLTAEAWLGTPAHQRLLMRTVEAIWTP
jgi:hypothetical protein